VTDRREDILARIRVILETIPGLAVGAGGQVRGVGRNRDDVSLTARPIAILRDGNEERVPMEGRGPRRSAQQMMLMHPQIFVNAGALTEELGPLMSGFRLAIVNAICDDPTLIDLVGGERGNGDITYEGLVFDSTAGEKREGLMDLNFTLRYPFIRQE